MERSERIEKAARNLLEILDGEEDFHDQAEELRAALRPVPTEWPYEFGNRVEVAYAGHWNDAVVVGVDGGTGVRVAMEHRDRVHTVTDEKNIRFPK